ncbi:MAG: hypothetical protein GXX85_10290 [Ignavibacteria bacterium]|nr:hypothetical protein [Ignavibacteria bacterium]
MLPPTTNPKWEKLVTGQIQANFRVFAGNMLLNRLSRKIKMDNSKQSVNDAVKEAHEYFNKHYAVYNEELSKIFNGRL